MLYEVKTEPDSPSEHDTTPPWQKRKPIEIIEIEDDEDEVKTESTSDRTTPRPPFEPMKFSGTAAFMAHLKQVDPLIEQVKIVCRLKKYDSTFDTCQQILMQMEADLLNYPHFLLSEEQEQTSQKILRVRRYILELQNRKYCLLWNEMCERYKSEPVNRLVNTNKILSASLPRKNENHEGVDPRIGSGGERYRFLKPAKNPTATSQGRKNSEISNSEKQTTSGQLSTEIPSTSESPHNDPAIFKSAKLIPATRASQEQNLKASKLAEKDEVGSWAREKAKTNSRQNELEVESPGAPELPKRNASGNEIPKKSTTVGKSSRQNNDTQEQSRQNPGTSAGSKNRISKRRREYDLENDQLSDQNAPKKSRTLETKLHEPNIDVRRNTNTESPSQPSSHRRDHSPSYYTLEERSFNSNNASNISHPGLLSRRERHPSTSNGVSKTLPKPPDPCFFCQGEHYSNYCTVVNTLEDRKEFYENRNRCLKCGRSRNHKHECFHYCKWKCGTKGEHHSALCPQAPYPITEKVINYISRRRDWIN